MNGNPLIDKTRMAIKFNQFFKPVFSRGSIQQEAIPREDDVNNIISEPGVLPLLPSPDAKKSSGPGVLPSATLRDTPNRKVKI